MPELSETIVSLLRTKREAQEQGGLLGGKDPSAFNSFDPIRLWIIQVGIIITTTQLLALGLQKIRQPKVIAEVIGGIILGPTAFGRIPGFTDHVFPSQSRSYLSLVANIGLCLFLFLVGLEIDSAVIKRNAKLSATVALAGMVLPFGLGAALAVPLYNHFIDSHILFTHFMLFSGVAFSITAFPVLCRILTELKLLDTTVGIVVLSAGVGNDIIGWTLLALSVALVNAGSGLTALWILMVCVAWTLFLLFPVKRGFRWLAHHTGSVQNGPTTFFMTATILLVFGSAFFTDIIGVHAIFGAFLAGIIVPREGNLAIVLTEKLEDMVSIIFLPLYFTLSGLSTDLGLLDNGITWAFTVAICSLAFLGKFGGCTLAARYSGFNWRESSAIGALMSCKGLVELIVLNVGLSAGILSQRVFSMFVLEALLLTFMTTPLVTFLYPPEQRVRVSATGANFKNVPGGVEENGTSTKSRSSSSEDGWKTRFTVVLDKIDHLPGMMALTQLIQPSSATDSEMTTRRSSTGSSPSVIRNGKMRSQSCSVDAFRLIELSDRTSAVMKSSAADTLLYTDPLLGIFKMFGELNDIPVSTSLSIVTFDDFAHSVVDHANNSSSNLILIPWLPPSIPATIEPNEVPTSARALSHSNNPFDALFKATLVEKSPSALHSHFVRGVFSQSKTDVALFIDRGHAQGGGGTVGSRHHIFLPFFGGPDDRLALDFAVQLCINSKISATVVRVAKMESSDVEEPEAAHLQDEKNEAQNRLTVASAAGLPDTVYGHATTQTRLQSETADNITWTRYASHPADDVSNTALTSALSRMEFVDLASPVPLHALIQRVSSQFETMIEKRTGLLVVVGRSRRLALEDHHQELKELMDDHGPVGSEVKKTIGDVATGFVVSGCKANIVVLQTANDPSG